MLKHLYDLAIAEDLISDLDYEWHNHVRFCIELGGETPQITDLSGIPAGKHYRENPVMRIPSRIGRTSGTAANFLVDNVKYVFGWHPEKEVKDEVDLFRAEVASALETMTGEEEKLALLAILNFLDLPIESRIAALRSFMGETPSKDMIKAIGSENFAFRYLPCKRIYIHLYPAIEAYWHIKNNPEMVGDLATCVVTGESCITVKNHKSVMVPGAGKPIPLISFNEEAFESHGLKGNDNCPVSKKASLAVWAAASRLLTSNPVKSGPNPNISVSLPRRNVALTKDTSACFWVKSDNLNEAAEPDFLMMRFNEPKPEELRAILETPKNGHRPEMIDESPFMMMVIQGVAGRPIFRSFTESTTKEVAENIIRYADDLNFIQGRKPYYPGINDLVKCLNGSRSNAALNAGYAMSLAKTAFQGDPLPKMIFQAAVNRIGSEGPNDKNPKSPVYLKRLSLLKLYLNRTNRYEVKMSLDKMNTNPAYLCGRLLATYNKMQYEAMPKVSRTLVDSNYRSFRSTPAASHAGLVVKVQHYSRIIRRDKYGMEVILSKVVAEILSQLKEFPTRMALEDQALFDIGFAHQNTEFFTTGWTESYKSASEEISEKLVEV